MPQRTAGAFAPSLPLASGLSNREVKSDFEHLAVLYAAGRHITLAPPNYAMVGQALLGADLRATPLLSRDDSGGRSTENPGSSADSCSNCRKAATPLARGAPRCETLLPVPFA
jgi:hypothetical protein